MILDEYLKLSEDQEIKAAAQSTKAINLQANRDVGEGTDLYFVFNVTQTFTTATKLNVKIITGDAAAAADSTKGTKEEIAQREVPVAKLNAGDYFFMRIDPVIASLGKDYLYVTYTPDVDATKGKITCNVTLTLQDMLKYYPTSLEIK